MLNLDIIFATLRGKWSLYMSEIFSKGTTMDQLLKPMYHYFDLISTTYFRFFVIILLGGPLHLNQSNQH